MFCAWTDGFRFKLRTRILASTTALLALAMIAAFTWSAINVRGILQARNDRFLKQKLAELTTALREQSADQADTALVDELRRETESHADDGLFAILRRHGHAEFFPDTEYTRAADQQVRKIDPDSRRIELTLELFGSTARVIRSISEPADRESWAIDLGMRMDQTDATLNDFFRRLAVGGGGFLVLAVLGGIVLTRISLRPLARSIDAARRLSPEDLTARLPMSGSGDQLDQLAATINVLLDRVAQKHGQMLRFTSDASHELRSPLAALRAAIEVSLQQPRGNDSYRELLGSLSEQCQRLTNLVNSLLLLARADSGQVALEYSQFDLAGLIRESVDLFQPLAEERRVALECDLPDRYQIEGDRLRLGQLVTNLLDNAIKYTNPQGAVCVFLTTASGIAELTISDTGVGIDAGKLPYIFDRFYRADDSRAGAGTGLGLSICHWIVHAHHGTIAVRSEPGQGTAVTVKLPLEN